MENWIAWKSRTAREKRILAFMGIMTLIAFFPFVHVGCLVQEPIPKTESVAPMNCDCPDYVKKELIEYQYEQLIRPIVVEAVGFQGMVLRDSIGTIFVITDDKALHEVLQYSYNVGDTIK